MNYNYAYPSELLRPYIKQYWSIENKVNSGENYSHRIVPSGLPELIMYIDHRPTSTGRRFEEHLLLNGQHNDYYDLHISENLAVFSILFHPHGLSQFLNLPLNELANQSIPLKYINSPLSNELKGRLTDASSFQDRIRTVEFYLYQLLAKNNDDFQFKRVGLAIELIRRTRGNIDISTLADNTCLSRKQFERTFTAQIGISPKQFLKTIRFQHAVFNKSVNVNLSMTDLAYECGYYDQSHFISEFKSLTGFTPKQYFQICAPVSDFFAQ